MSPDRTPRRWAEQPPESEDGEAIAALLRKAAVGESPLDAESLRRIHVQLPRQKGWAWPGWKLAIASSCLAGAAVAALLPARELEVIDRGASRPTRKVRLVEVEGPVHMPERSPFDPAAYAIIETSTLTDEEAYELEVGPSEGIGSADPRVRLDAARRLIEQGAPGEALEGVRELCARELGSTDELSLLRGELARRIEPCAKRLEGSR
ncbi:MAG: hypothetical protein HYV07_23565 [Deltaproteobacteria bacterium]|nr:hypothetical protein [Deltaproteobacteria bacterium]